MSKASRKRREQALMAYLNRNPEGQRRIAKEYESYAAEKNRARRENIGFLVPMQK